jgi:hypothetical protein
MQQLRRRIDEKPTLQLPPQHQLRLGTLLTRATPFQSTCSPGAYGLERILECALHDRGVRRLIVPHINVYLHDISQIEPARSRILSSWLHRLVSLDASRSSSTLGNSHQHDRHQNLMPITKPVIGNKSRRHIQIGQNQSIGMGLAILLDGFERRKCVPANDRSGAWRRWPASGDAS